MTNRYNVRSLITRGSNHPLRCEDDLLINETDDTIMACVYDGCSSGIDSHVASSIHKKMMSQLLYRNPDFSPESVAKEILRYTYEMLFDYNDHFGFEINKEMLSTIVILLVNKHNSSYSVLVAGDGVVSIDGSYFNVHDKDGDSVYYLSSIICDFAEEADPEIFEKYYAEHCTVLSGSFLRSVSISTDGIDTFKTKFGVASKESSRDFFMQNRAFEKAENQLKRLYNIYTQGLHLEEKVPCMNADDFTMITISKNNGPT
jgi:hypothetical protein